jgi:selenocysteine-specific elongation factor
MLREAVLGAHGLATHQPVMAAADSALWGDLEPLLREHPLRPPPVHNLASAMAMEVAELRRRLASLARWGLVEQVADNRFFAADQMARLRALAVEAAAQAEDGQFSAGAFRDLSGIGRNLTIEVLEYFDRTGVTNRDHEGRRTIHPGFTVAEE